MDNLLYWYNSPIRELLNKTVNNEEWMKFYSSLSYHYDDIVTGLSNIYIYIMVKRVFSKNTCLNIN